MTLPVYQSDSLPPFHVIVKFGKGVLSEQQGECLLAWEKWARERGLPLEVFLERRPDDSKLRLHMTVEERNSL